MEYYAFVQDEIVTKVIVADSSFFVNKVETEPGEWIQTSYNTKAGVHLNGGTPLRKNYAGIGYTYDKTRDAFVPPKQHESWTLNEDTCQWDPPTSYPDDGKEYTWDEGTTSWVEVEE